MEGKSGLEDNHIVGARFEDKLRAAGRKRN
jgi:hypothetical protein